MSTTIDQKVVEMRFDNQHFEQNVSTTMSTLDKLKQKLNLNGAAKGMENVNAAAKNVNLSGIGSAVDTVQAKFSAMQVVGVTALANITNSAVNAGKRIVSALTIDPVKTGFQEYETQINAVQTILANTSHQGTNIDDVNRALEELNEYADMTIYNFTEMTRNIGTFTAAGLDLDTSTKAIQGIANLAAVSGSTSQQASTAMYQLSQALSAGTVRLMDWNSVVNAGMGGKVFQDAIINTARNIEGFDQAVVKAYDSGKSFRELLNPTDYGNWFTSDILSETLTKFTESGAVEYLSELYTISGDNLGKLQEVGKTAGFTSDEFKKMALSLANGDEAIAKNITDILTMSNTATDAATKVKTFTQLWDVMKESAQSGWAQTWKIIVGDFEEAKAFLTPLSDTFTSIINKMSDWRNDILESALGRGIGKLSEGITSMLEPVAAVSDTIKDTVGVIEDLGTIVDDVILGKFGNGKDRYNALTEAGINYYKVQNKVNEKLGDSFRHSEEAIAAQDKLLGVQSESTEKTKEQTDATVKLTVEQKNRLKELAQMTEAEMEAAGYTKEQIQAMKDLGEQANKLGIPMGEFIDNLDQINGRWLLLNSFKNIGKSIADTFNAIKGAWTDIFPPKSTEEIATGLFNAIAAFHKFTSSLRLVDSETGEFTETGKNLQRTFKGVFAIVDMLTTILGGGFKIAFKVISSVLSYFDMDILSVTAAIGDSAVALNKWFDSLFDVSGILDVILPYVKKFGKTIGSWTSKLKGINVLDKFVEYILKAKSAIVGFLSSTGDTDSVAADIIAGLVNGLQGGVQKVWTAALEIGKSILESIKNLLGIHSPSTEMEEVGTNTIDGFVLGIQNGASRILESLKNAFSGALEWAKNIDFGSIFAAGIGVSTAVTAINFGKAIVAFSKPFEALGSVFEGTGDLLSGVGKVLRKSAGSIKKILNNTAKVVKSFSKILNAVAFDMRVDAIAKLAQTLLLLIGAIIVLTFFDPKELLASVCIVGALALVLVGLAWAINKIGNSSATIDKNVLNVAGLSAGLLGIGTAILLMAAAVKMLGTMDPEQAKQGFIGLAGLIVAIAGVMGAFALLNLGSGKAAENIDKFGGTMLKLSVALLLMAAVVKLVSKLTVDEMKTGAIFLGGFLVFMALFNTVALIPSKNIDKLGGLVLKLSISLILMIAVVKFAAGLSTEEMESGAIFLGGFLVFVGILATIGALGGKSIDGVGKMMLSLSISMLLLVGVVKLIGMLEPGELAKGLAAIVLFAVIIGVFVKSVMKQGAEAPKVAATILAFAVAIGILAAIAFACSLISVEGLAKGLIAVGVLSSMMALMIAATRGATNVTGTIIGITVAIGLMVAAVALLTLIDPMKLAVTTTVLTVLMGMFALVIKVASTAQKAMGTIIAMTVAIAAIGGVLYLLSTLPIESTIVSAIVLSGLLLVMTGVLALLIPIGAMASSALIGVLALTAMALPLLAFAGVLALMSNVQNAITNAAALTLLATACSILLIPLTLVGALWPTALIGVAALTAMAVPMLAFVGVLAIMQNIENAMTNALALTLLMSTMGNLLVKLALIGPLATVGIAAMTALTGLMVGIGVLATAIGALVTQFPQLEQFLDTGIPIMEKMASGIGSVIASFITGFAGEVMTLLPQLGLSLSLFMRNLIPFIAGAKMIDEQVLAGVGIMTAAILALSIADFISGMLTLGGIGLVALGFTLSAFMDAASGFFEGAANIDPASMQGIKALSEAILIITAANVIDGLASLFGGGNALENFAAQLPILGTGLRQFSDNIGTFAEDQVATVNCAANAIKTLASAAAEIPNTGGLLAQLVGENDLGIFAAQFPILGSGLSQFLTNIGTFTEEQVATVTAAADAIKILAQASSEIPNSGGLLGQLVGENDLGTFAEQFPVLATGLRGFLDNIGTFTDEQVATVTAAADAIKSLASAAAEIPNTGGLLAQLVGDNELGTFAEQFPALGTGISGFLTNLGEFDASASETIICGANAVKALAEAASTIPNEGGWIAKLVGDNDLGTFASNFPAVGTGIAGFVENLGTFSEAQVATVYSGIAAINALSGLANADLKGATKHLTDFGDDLPSFAEDVASFCTSMPGAVSMNSAVSNINKLLDAVESIANANSGALSTFADNLNKVGKKAVDKFIEAFTSDTAKTDLKEASKDLAGKVIEGVEDKEDKIKTAGENAAKKAVDGVETQDDDMESAGKDLGSGLARGIKAKETAVYNAGYALGQKAVQGEKDGQKSNSPSKLTMLAGEWLGEGLIVGMKNIGNSVYKAGNRLGDSATDSVSSTISSIASLVNSDIDSQPTIRPVLDLSEVRTGANAISGMFNTKASVGVSATVGAISTAMNYRSQNGGNDVIVSAIDKLRKDVGNISKPSYNINGITYDDGSAVSEAIQTLIRVAKVERRV